LLDSKQVEIYKPILWVNPIIMIIFFIFDDFIRPLLGWQEGITYAVGWFALFVIVTILVNYFLYLRWKKIRTKE
jgi:hypothetical protein